MILSKAQILAADDRRFEVVPVPEWKGDVVLRSLTENEYEAFQDSLYTRKGKLVEFNRKQIRAKLLALCLVAAADASAKPIFEEGELLGKSAGVLARLGEIAERLVGIDTSNYSESDQAKKSTAGQGESSSSN